MANIEITYRDTVGAVLLGRLHSWPEALNFIGLLQYAPRFITVRHAADLTRIDLIG